MNGCDSFLIHSIFYPSLCPVIPSSEYIPKMQLLPIFANVFLVQTSLNSHWILGGPLQRNSWLVLPPEYIHHTAAWMIFLKGKLYHSSTLLKTVVTTSYF